VATDHTRILKLYQLKIKEVMENLDLIILSSIVVTLFVVFGIAMYREFSKMSEETYVYTKETGGRASLVNFVGRLFDDENASKKMTFKQKDLMYKAMHRTIADMESEGIYFPEEVKEELKKQRDELHCEYSGLPSVQSYMEKSL
jgi:hypothetical protein